jgi:hypothetical protein
MFPEGLFRGPGSHPLAANSAFGGSRLFSAGVGKPLTSWLAAWHPPSLPPKDCESPPALQRKVRGTSARSGAEESFGPKVR